MYRLYFVQHISRMAMWSTYFSRSTGGLLISVMRLQYQIMMMSILGVRKVFMANQTLVKPPFWWMLLDGEERKKHYIKTFFLKFST